MEKTPEKRRQGRPTTPAYRKKRMRLSAIEDALLPIILRMPNTAEKNELLAAFEVLKKVD